MNLQTKTNILVIDDSLDILRWFKTLNTEDCPYLFHGLQNEINVAEAVAKLKPAIVFLDISLNTLDGPLIASILNGNGIPNSCIISISASASNKKAIDEENFLLKPLTKVAVLEKIKAVLK